MAEALLQKQKTGRRKKSVARIQIFNGTGSIVESRTAASPTTASAPAAARPMASRKTSPPGTSAIASERRRPS